MSGYLFPEFSWTRGLAVQRRGTLTRINHIAAPADMLPRLDHYRVLVRTGIRLQVPRSIRRHDLSSDSSLPRVLKATEREKTQHDQQRPINSCWTAGRTRPEVIGAVEQALEEKKAKFDDLVDTEKTADAIKDSFIKTVTGAMKPLLARRPKDKEEWVVRHRAQGIDASTAMEG